MTPHDDAATTCSPSSTALGIAHRTLEHPAVFRVGEGEEIKAALPGGHTKNLFLKDAKGQLWLVSALRRDADRPEGAAGARSARRGCRSARPTLMARRLGVDAGLGDRLRPDQRRGPAGDASCSTRRSLAADPVNFHPLTNTATTAVSQAGFRPFWTALGVEPMVVEFGAA